MKTSTRDWIWAAVLTLVIAASMFSRSEATPLSNETEASRLSLQTKDTGNSDSDTLRAVGGIDSTNTYRIMAVSATGRVIVDGGSLPSASAFVTAQTTVAGTCTAVPASQTSGTDQTCLFNQSTTDNAMCGNSASCTTANTTMIEPRTGRCFPTSAVVRCIRGSATSVTVDSTEYQ